ncbi:MAG: DUF4337 family protein [Vulcanimicrobiaceae bacterium]
MHKTMHGVTERHEQTGNASVAVIASTVAVLAAIGTLLSAHRSIHALSIKNQAVLSFVRASDRYAHYQAKRVKVHIYAAFAATSPGRQAARFTLIADKERQSATPILAQAKALDAKASREERASERLLSSFETIGVGTTLLEISIVLVSISALGAQRVLMWSGCVLAAVGVAFLILGFLSGT